MIRLSVNVNKVATLRNSRGGAVPSVLAATRMCIEAGAGGITVHPRQDERHITSRDVHALAETFSARWGSELEYNVEGDPRPDWLDLVCEMRPQQATLVPVTPGELTSHAGWQPSRDRTLLERSISKLKALNIRVSLFVDAEESALRWAAALGADRVELYTEPYARAFERGPDAARVSLARYSQAAELAHSLGMGVNAGHDLDDQNLSLFRNLPHLAEVSIGHALMSLALFEGLPEAIRRYLAVLGHT